MNRRLESLIDTYRLHRNLITDVLRQLSDEQLQLTIGKNMGTLGKQFRHIGDIQLCYIDALKTKKMSFFRSTVDHSLEESRELLLGFLTENDQRMLATLEGLGNEELEKMRIDWTHKSHQIDEQLSVYDHLNDLIRHEILHQGEIIVYLRTLELPFPASWRLWGFSRKPKRITAGSLG